MKRKGLEMVRREAQATRAAPTVALATVAADGLGVGNVDAELAESAPERPVEGVMERADVAPAAESAAIMAEDGGRHEWANGGDCAAGDGVGQPDAADTDGARLPGAERMVARIGYAPIVRVDAERREIELCATSEAIDSHGTIFDYEASKAAFLRWLGNVREMHERRAVGSRVAVRCDDEARKIFVRLRISRGAQDTWEKVMDGTLRGASIGATGVVWRRERRRVAGQERTLDVATRYELAELSLVDNPSNPDALGVTFVRDAAPDLALLDELERRPLAPSPRGRGENEPVQLSASITELRAPQRNRGARPIQEPRCYAPLANMGSAGRAPTRGEAFYAPTLWDANAGVAGDQPLDSGKIGDGVEAEANAMSARGMAAASTQRAQGPFSPNAAGYPDLGVPERAEGRPTAALDLPGLVAPADGAANARERFHDATRSLLLGCGCLLCQAALAALDDDAGADGAARGVADATGDETRLAEAALTRMVTAGLSASAERLAAVDVALREVAGATQAMARQLTESLAQTRETQGELRSRVAALEAQPAPGGPAARPVEKAHPLAAQAARGGYGAASGLGSASASAAGWPGGAGYLGEPVSAEEQCRALESLAGRLRDPQAQIVVAAELIRLRQG